MDPRSNLNLSSFNFWLKYMMRFPAVFDYLIGYLRFAVQKIELGYIIRLNLLMKIQPFLDKIGQKRTELQKKPRNGRRERNNSVKSNQQANLRMARKPSWMRFMITAGRLWKGVPVHNNR